jgi:hypothetical protein
LRTIAELAVCGAHAGAFLFALIKQLLCLHAIAEHGSEPEPQYRGTPRLRIIQDLIESTRGRHRSAFS